MMLIDELENRIKIVLALPLLANKITSIRYPCVETCYSNTHFGHLWQMAAITRVIENGMISSKQRDA